MQCVSSKSTCMRKLNYVCGHCNLIGQNQKFHALQPSLSPDADTVTVIVAWVMVQSLLYTKSRTELFCIEVNSQRATSQEKNTPKSENAPSTQPLRKYI